jgi:hypothetical protein
MKVEMEPQRVYYLTTRKLEKLKESYKAYQENIIKCCTSTRKRWFFWGPEIEIQDDRTIIIMLTGQGNQLKLQAIERVEKLQQISEFAIKENLGKISVSIEDIRLMN